VVRAAAPAAGTGTVPATAATVRLPRLLLRPRRRRAAAAARAPVAAAVAAPAVVEVAADAADLSHKV
jgi:enoyl-CoA hydratase/carnithine racemase